jgi:DNA repair ATPase RecN
MELKQKRLDLLDNLSKLREADESGFNAIKETCDKLMAEIKETKDNIRIAKIKNEVKAEIGESGKEECIAELKNTAADILRFKRLLDGLKPEEKSLTDFPDPRILSKKISKLFDKKSKLKEYDDFLTALCEDMKKIVHKLDEVSSLKQYDFVVDFANYFIEAVPRTFDKEK